MSNNHYPFLLRPVYYDINFLAICLRTLPSLGTNEYNGLADFAPFADLADTELAYINIYGIYAGHVIIDWPTSMTQYGQISVTIELPTQLSRAE